MEYARNIILFCLNTNAKDIDVTLTVLYFEKNRSIDNLLCIVSPFFLPFNLSKTLVY